MTTPGCAADSAYEELVSLHDTIAEEVARQRVDIDVQRAAAQRALATLEGQAEKLDRLERTLRDLRGKVETGCLPPAAAVTQLSQGALERELLPRHFSSSGFAHAVHERSARRAS